MKKLWNDLEIRFGQSNRAQLFHLQKEMSDFLQGSLNIVAYYTKIKRLWDELDTLNTKSVCSCTCYYGGKEKIVKAQQDERAIHFLMGLSEAYVVVRSTILMISPLPSVSLDYSLLIQDEK